MRAFARHIGISQSQLSVLLARQRLPSIGQSIKVIRTLVKDVDTLERILGIPISAWIASNSLVVVAEESKTPKLPDKLGDAETLAQLKSGVWVSPESWQDVVRALSAFFSSTRNRATGSIAIKLVEKPI